MSAARIWMVTISDGRLRYFRKWAWAERWARRAVEQSATDEFAISADIDGPGESASVRLDGNNRVWTDFYGRRL